MSDRSLSHPSKPPSDVSIADLVRRLAEAEVALNEALDGPVDAIIDPDRATPILLYQAQAALRRSEARYDRLMARIAAVVIELTPDGTIQYVNDAASTVTGYRADELLGRRAQDILFPGELADQIDSLKAHFQAGDVSGFELLMSAKDGDVIVLEFNSANDYDENGNLETIVGLGIDVTQRKQAERELTDYRRHLERLVDERTAQLRKSNDALQLSEERYRLAARATQDVIWDWDLTTGRIQWNAAIAGQMGYLEAMQGTSVDWWEERIHPDDHDDVMRSIMAVIEGAGASWSSEYRFLKADGEYAHVLDRGHVAYDDDNRPVRMVGAMFDTTALRRAEAAEREQRMLAEALREIALKMISVHELPDVLDSILSGVGSVVPYETADLMLTESDGTIVIAGSRGYEGHDVEPPSKSADLRWWDYPLLRRIMETGQPVIVPDIQTCDEWVYLSPNEWRHGYVGVPLQLEDNVIGFINLTSTTNDFFTPTMVERLELLAHQAALAVKEARLYQQAKSLAAAQERERLARDLHDAVSQTLFSASMIAEAVQRQWGTDPHLIGARLDQLLQLTRGAQAEMRTLLLELRPTALLETNLGTLLAQLAMAVQSRKRIDISLQVEESIELPPDVKICLYRIAQESLNNIVKHAQAAEATVRFQRQQNRVVLELADNGRGFDPAAAIDGLGLKMMRERAEAVGAQVTMDSDPQQGTWVRVIWPGTAEAHGT